MVDGCLYNITVEVSSSLVDSNLLWFCDKTAEIPNDKFLYINENKGELFSITLLLNSSKLGAEGKQASTSNDEYKYHQAYA